MGGFLEVGQTVVLKSGGPEMTINKIDDYAELVYCVWFNVESVYPQQWSDLQIGEFGYDAIKRVN